MKTFHATCRSFAMVLVLAVGALADTNADAQATAQATQSNLEIVSCASGPPSTTVTLALPAPGGGASSADASYITSGCKMYTVDVKFSGVSSPKYITTMTWGYATSLTQARDIAQDYVQLYRKQAGQAVFTPLAGGGTRRGKWTGSSCVMTGAASFTDPRFTSFLETDTWRVALVGIVGGSAQKVRLSLLVGAVPG